MKYDFESIIDRKGKDALAIDLIGDMEAGAPGAPAEGFDAIPMWVADMNFAVVPTIQERIAERLAHPCFGYFTPRDEYYQAIIDWQRNRNGVTGLERRHINYDNGVLGGVVSALNVLCTKGEKVLLHSPTYIGFTHALDDNGYRIELSPLKKDEAGIWRMDYEDMERRIVKNRIHTCVFCSPHNPCGRVWEREELEKAYAIFEKYNVSVISDEIWSDLTLGNFKHIPSQSVNEYAKENTIAIYAPSKTFNLAGLVGSYDIIYNDCLRDRFEHASSMSHYNGMNVLSMYGLLGAYCPEGEEWLGELKTVLTANAKYACDFIERELPGVSCARPQGTYMLFADCTGYCRTHGISIDTLEKRFWDCGVTVQDGRMFHGECSVRINLAVPFTRVEEAFRRMKQYVFTP